MSLEAWIGIIAGIVIPVIGWSIYHALHDKEVQSELKTRIKRIEEDIGTHETGMRGTLHKHSNFIGALRSVVYFIGRKLKLEVMKDLDEDK